MTDTKPSSPTPPTERQITISRNDLPLHCPMPDAELWSSHPRVYLPIEESGQELCPYCGTLYVLRDDTER